MLFPMTAISLKLPNGLASLLDVQARYRKKSRPALIREYLENELSGAKSSRQASCLNLMRDLVGTQTGPSDASTNKNYLNDLARENRRAHSEIRPYHHPRASATRAPELT